MVESRIGRPVTSPTLIGANLFAFELNLPRILVVKVGNSPTRVEKRLARKRQAPLLGQQLRRGVAERRLTTPASSLQVFKIGKALE
ncbi:hypothetical protein [Bradyrhizobium sp. USDA 10063]